MVDRNWLSIISSNDLLSMSFVPCGGVHILQSCCLFMRWFFKFIAQQSIRISDGMCIQSLSSESSKLTAAALPSPTSRIHFANSSTSSFLSWDVSPVDSLIFSVSLKTVKCFHNLDLLMEAFTTSSLVPSSITGRICRKSPPSTSVFFPNNNLPLFASIIRSARAL